MLEAVRVDFIEMVMRKQKEKWFSERTDPYGYMGGKFQTVDPEAESLTEL